MALLPTPALAKRRRRLQSPAQLLVDHLAPVSPGPNRPVHRLVPVSLVRRRLYLVRSRLVLRWLRQPVSPGRGRPVSPGRGLVRPVSPGRGQLASCAVWVIDPLVPVSLVRRRLALVLRWLWQPVSPGCGRPETPGRGLVRPVSAVCCRLLGRLDHTVLLLLPLVLCATIAAAAAMLRGHWCAAIVNDLVVKSGRNCKCTGVLHCPPIVNAVVLVLPLTW